MIGKKIKLYFWLFGIHLFISTFTFGGGYVVVPMIRKYFVVRKKLFREDELLDMAAIAQSSPGAIAVNLSALAGYRAGGMPGLWISSLASVLPPLILLSVISKYYTAFAENALAAAVLKGMQAGLAALIIDLVADMTGVIVKERSLFYTFLIPASFLAAYVFHVPVAGILLVCCGLCLLHVIGKQKGGIE